MSDSLAALRALVQRFPSVLLGYSGGVDSALLAVVLRQELGRDRMVAAIGRSASYPEAQWRGARDVAERFDVPLAEIATFELDDPRYLANPTNRCFFCKTELWSRLVPRARIEVEPAWIAIVSDRLPEVRTQLAELGFAGVEIDPRGYRRGSLLAGRPAQQ